MASRKNSSKLQGMSGEDAKGEGTKGADWVCGVCLQACARCVAGLTNQHLQVQPAQ